MMSRTPSPRDPTGRFVKGNPFGQQNRYRPGECGNPKGRPLAIEAYFDRFVRQRFNVNDLLRLLSDPATRRPEREAARWGILCLTAARPIDGADPATSTRYYRRWYRKPYKRLVVIYLDEGETPERREAARRRLYKWWVAPALDRAQRG